MDICEEGDPGLFLLFLFVFVSTCMCMCTCFVDILLVNTYATLSR